MARPPLFNDPNRQRRKRQAPIEPPASYTELKWLLTYPPSNPDTATRIRLRRLWAIYQNAISRHCDRRHGGTRSIGYIAWMDFCEMAIPQREREMFERADRETAEALAHLTDKPPLLRVWERRAQGG